MSTDNDVLREAESLYRELSNGLVALERSPEEVAVAELFRAAHTLKGNCAMAGIDGAATLAHAVEDLLAAVRSGAVVPSGVLVDGALDAVDDIEAILNAVDEGVAAPAVDPDATAAALGALIKEQRETDSEVSSATMGTTDVPGLDLELPEPDADLSAEEALERVSIFDDLEKLVATIDDDDAFARLSGAGTFDEIEDETSSLPPDGQPLPPDVEDDPFEWVKAETTEETDVDALQVDLEDVSFGEFDDEDQMSIRELIEIDPSESDTTDSSESDAVEPLPPDVEDDPFEWVKLETTEETDVDALQADLEDVSFGEFDDEDQMSIQELIEIDPSESDTTDSSESDAVESPPDASEDTTDDSDTTDDTSTIDDADTTDDTSTTDKADTIDDTDTTDDTSTTDDLFGWVRGETTDESDVESLQADLEDVSFGEFDDEDEMSIRELIEIEPSESDTPGSSGGSLDKSTDTDDVIENIDLNQTESSLEPDDIEFESKAETKAFAERFGELFEVESDGEGATRSVGTIEDSTLDTDRFRQATPVDIDPSDTSIHSISVDVETADDLLNLVEELSITRLLFEDALDDGISEEIRDVRGALLSIEAEFRQSVTDLRLMALSSAVDGLARVTRDIARDQQKQISFDIEGADVKLDRSVAERIGEPLVHLVRNAADHGIEPPEEREEAGKPTEGRIELRAKQVRNGAVIEIEDDGRGIDPDAVLTTGVEEGVVTQNEAETMDEEDAYDLLFHHGLSTCEEITNVSGRGVGMDIVARVCSDLDGSIEVESEPGEGTTIRLRLPITVAMAKLLFIEASGKRYAIRMSDIEHIGRPSDENGIAGREFVPGPSPDWGEPTDDKDDRYQLVQLHEAFDVPARSSDEGVVVWFRPELGRIAIYCDGVVESREAVVKPYGPPLDHVSGISGATTGESGTIINIIDVTTIA